MKCEVEIDVEIPDGYKIKRIGLPRMGEQYVNGAKACRVETATNDFQHVNCVIVEKDLKWRTASPQEVMEKLLLQKPHTIRARGKAVTTIYNMTLESVYITDEDGIGYGVGWDQVEILEEPS